MLKVCSFFAMCLFSVCVSALELSKNDVNFVALVASPEKYDDATVVLSGVLDTGDGERGNLFLCAEHYKYNITGNAIKLMAPDGFGEMAKSGEYFFVTGEPKLDEQGRLLYLDNIRDVYPVN